MAQTSTPARTAVPFLDLAVIHRGLKDAVLADVAGLIDSGAFTNGPQVAEFETAFADFCGAGACVGVASGLDALRLALLSLGIEPGDEVVVPACTFIATWEAVSQAGGVPVPVDVSERDLNLDPAALAAVVGPRTRFVLPVHLYGQLADMRALSAVAARYELLVVEDACQAHGASRDGVRAGELASAAAYSFYPGKNLGAFGDAGALTTDDDELAGRVRALREHGQRAKYRHEAAGYTARLDTVQAIALLHKLPHLTSWNGERAAAAQLYSEALEGVGDLVLPPVPPGSEPVWHLYAVRTADPVALGEALQAHGIGTGRHYPEPPHLSAAYAALGHVRGAFPVAESVAAQTLSLPLYPGIAERQVLAVVDAVGEFFASGR